MSACFVILQHLLFPVKCTHQSMPIIMTLSTELRVAVATVGGIHLVAFKWVSTQKNMSTVMAHNLNWLILTLD